MSTSKPICDLGGCPCEPEDIKRRVIRALDQAGLHWQATDFFVRSYENESPNGLRQAAAQFVTISDWRTRMAIPIEQDPDDAPGSDDPEDGPRA